MVRTPKHNSGNYVKRRHQLWLIWEARDEKERREKRRQNKLKSRENRHKYGAKRVYCPVAGKRKLLFKTEELAQEALNAARHRLNRGPQSIYYCIDCGGWHMTHYTFEEHRFFSHVTTSPTQA